MGKWGICGGKVALSQCTSLCGMPGDWEGHSQALHRSYLLPISPNVEQAGDDAHVAGVEHTSTSAPMPSVDSEPLTQSCLEWPCQIEWVTHLRVVWTNLLHSDAAHMEHRTNFHGGTTILHYWQTPACPASWMCGLVCAFVFI